MDHEVCAQVLGGKALLGLGVHARLVPCMKTISAKSEILSLKGLVTTIVAREG